MTLTLLKTFPFSKNVELHLQIIKTADAATLESSSCCSVERVSSLTCIMGDEVHTQGHTFKQHKLSFEVNPTSFKFLLGPIKRHGGSCSVRWPSGSNWSVLQTDASSWTIWCTTLNPPPSVQRYLSRDAAERGETSSWCEGAGNELCSPCYHRSKVSLSRCHCSPGLCARAAGGSWPRQTPSCPAFLQRTGPSDISAAAEGIWLHTKGSGPAVLFLWKRR